ncbi:hypothetical protein HDU91_002179, partial [Kappamyces sp. JEL0680]
MSTVSLATTVSTAASLSKTTSLQPTVAAAPRKRRPRTSVQQLAILQEAYTLEPMPCSAYREMLSEIVGLSSRSIQIWFQNRRQKLKLEENKETSAMLAEKKEQALALLNASFELSHEPSDAELARLSQEIGISSKSIKVWFQNKSARVLIEDQMTTGASFKPKPSASEEAERKGSAKEPASSPTSSSSGSATSKRTGRKHDRATSSASALPPIPPQMMQNLQYMNQVFLLQDSSLPHFTSQSTPVMFVKPEPGSVQHQIQMHHLSVQQKLSLNTSNLQMAGPQADSPVSMGGFVDPQDFFVDSFSAPSPTGFHSEMASPMLGMDPTLSGQFYSGFNYPLPAQGLSDDAAGFSAFQSQSQAYPSMQMNFEPYGDSQRVESPSPLPEQDVGCHTGLWGTL